jgi:hypothetical protein
MLTVVNDIKNQDSPLTDGYIIMQITLFRVIMALPTLMVDEKHASQVLKTYGQVFVQSRGFFLAFIENGRPWQTAVECLRFLITLTQSDVIGARDCFIEIYQSGGLDEFSDVGAIHILLLSMWLGVDVCTLDELLLATDGRESINNNTPNSNSKSTDSMAKLFGLMAPDAASISNTSLS